MLLAYSRWEKAERRLRWIGHLIRNPDPSTTKAYEEHKHDPSSRWWRLVRSDLRRFGMTITQVERLAKDKDRWSRKLSQKMTDLIPELHAEVDQDDEVEDEEEE